MAMLERVSAFIKVSHFVLISKGFLTDYYHYLQPGVPQTRENTLKILESYFTEAQAIGAKTKLKNKRTKTGVKDTVQEFFLEKLYQSYQDKRGPKAKQKALDAAVAALPDDITSPVWRLQGMLFFLPNCFFYLFEATRS